MNPLKAKDLLPKVSESTGLPLDLLTNLTDFYWDTTHKSLVSLDYSHVLLPHLGTFSIKGDRVLDRELDKIYHIYKKQSYSPPTTPVRYSRFVAIKNQVEKLQNLKKIFFGERDSRRANRKLRRELRASKEGMEKQG